MNRDASTKVNDAWNTLNDLLTDTIKECEPACTGVLTNGVHAVNFETKQGYVTSVSVSHGEPQRIAVQLQDEDNTVMVYTVIDSYRSTLKRLGTQPGTKAVGLVIEAPNTWIDVETGNVKTNTGGAK
jgi:hypothetical protein